MMTTVHPGGAALVVGPREEFAREVAGLVEAGDVSGLLGNLVRRLADAGYPGWERATLVFHGLPGEFLGSHVITPTPRAGE